MNALSNAKNYASKTDLLRRKRHVIQGKGPNGEMFPDLLQKTALVHLRSEVHAIVEMYTLVVSLLLQN